MTLKAKDIMRRRVVLVRDDTTLPECARLVTEHRVSGLPVVDAGQSLVGIISQADLVRAYQAEPGGRQLRLVRDAMTRGAVTVREDEPIESLVALMLSRRIHRVVVLAGEAICGIVSTMDIIGVVGVIGGGRSTVPQGGRDATRRSYSNLYSNRHERLLLRLEHIEKIQEIQRLYAAQRLHEHRDPLTISDVVNACLDALFEFSIPFARAGSATEIQGVITDFLFEELQARLARGSDGKAQ